MARRDPRGGPVRRDPRRRLRVPDRDDVPGQPGRGAHREVPITFAIDASARARCRGGSSSRRSSSSSSSGRMNCAERFRRRREHDVAAGGTRGVGTGDRSASAQVGTSRGVRVVLDARPLQEPDRSPLTALYLAASWAPSMPTRSQASPSRSCSRRDLADPTDAFEESRHRGRRQLPPTRLLRAGAMTLDPFLLRGASMGAAWHAERGGAAGAVYHAAGSGPLPIASGLPVVVTLLDLAPWEMPEVFGRTVGGPVRPTAAGPAHARGGRGHRRHGGHGARDGPAAARPSATGMRVVPLAPRPAYSAWGRDAAGHRRPTGEPPRTRTPGIARAIPRLPGPLRRAPGTRHVAGGPRRPRRRRPSGWARQDPPVAAAGRSRGCQSGRSGRAGPSRRAAGHRGRADLRPGAARAAARPRPRRPRGHPAGRLRGRGPAGDRSDDLRHAGRGHGRGGLPELVGAAGMLVEPRDPERLAVALRAIWTDDRVHERIAANALERATWQRRSGPTSRARPGRSTRRSASRGSAEGAAPERQPAGDADGEAVAGGILPAVNLTE